MMMWEVTLLRKNSDNYARQLGKNSTGLKSLILAVKKHNGKYRSGLDEFYIPN